MPKDKKISVKELNKLLAEIAKCKDCVKVQLCNSHKQKLSGMGLKLAEQKVMRDTRGHFAKKDIQERA